MDQWINCSGTERTRSSFFEAVKGKVYHPNFFSGIKGRKKHTLILLKDKIVYMHTDKGETISEIVKNSQAINANRFFRCLNVSQQLKAMRKQICEPVRQPHTQLYFQAYSSFASSAAAK